MRKRKIISYLLIISVLLATNISNQNLFEQKIIAEAADVTNYTISDTISATLSTDGILDIKGTGDLPSSALSNNAEWYSKRSTIKQINIEEGITSICEAAFYEYYNLTSVNIASTVKKIGVAAFAESYNLSRISGMSGVESIGNYAFQNTSLKSFDFPKSTKTIGNYVFYACAEITTLSIPSGVQEVGVIGYGCANLLSINVVTDNANYASVDGILYTKDMKTLVEYPAGKAGNSYSVPSGVNVIGNYAFHLQKYLETVLLPSTVTEIGDYAFYMMPKLSSFTVSENVKSVGDAPFQGDSSLKKLIFKASITDTPYSMCKDCTSLTDVTLGNSITEVYNRAFMGCTSLVNVTMPSKLQKINGAAFLDCTSLVNVKYPTSLEYISSSAFTDSGVTQFPNWLSKRDDGAYVSLGSIVFDGTYKYDMAYEVLDVVNNERENIGLSGLKMDKELLESAMLRAAEIAAYYSHTRPDGSSATSVSPLLYAENIAIGYSSATSVMNGWMSSTGHKANILGNYTSNIQNFS